MKIPPPSRKTIPVAFAPEQIERVPILVNPDPNKFEINGSMLICRETMLPAYQDAAEHKKIQDKYFPGFITLKSWRCVHCGKWHFTGKFTHGSNGEQLADCDKSRLTKPSSWDRIQQLRNKKKDNQKKLL